MQNPSIFIENSGLLSKEVYNDSKLVKGLQFSVVGSNGEVNYEVIDTSSDLIGGFFPNFYGFQAMLVEKLDSSGNGTGSYEIVFRGTQFGKDFKYQSTADLVTDISMAMGNFTNQMELALTFVDKAIELHGISTTDLTFSGHSLGGSLAEVAGYTFGCDTYAFNPFGAKWSLTDLSSNLKDDYEEALEDLGLTSAKSTENINNVVNIGAESSDFITGFGSELLNSYLGDIIFIKNYEGGERAPHGINELNTSVYVYNKLIETFQLKTSVQ